MLKGRNRFGTCNWGLGRFIIFMIHTSTKRRLRSGAPFFIPQVTSLIKKPRKISVALIMDVLDGVDFNRQIVISSFRRNIVLCQEVEIKRAREYLPRHCPRPFKDITRELSTPLMI